MYSDVLSYIVNRSLYSFSLDCTERFKNCTQYAPLPVKCFPVKKYI